MNTPLRVEGRLGILLPPGVKRIYGTRRVTVKGQVVIPPDIVKEFGIKRGDKISIYVSGYHLCIAKGEPPDDRAIVIATVGVFRCGSSLCFRLSKRAMEFINAREGDDVIWYETRDGKKCVDVVRIVEAQVI